MAPDYAELYGLEDPDMVLKCFFPFVMNCGLQIDVHHSLRAQLSTGACLHISSCVVICIAMHCHPASAVCRGDQGESGLLACRPFISIRAVGWSHIYSFGFTPNILVSRGRVCKFRPV
jgi:hypothetical protein